MEFFSPPTEGVSRDNKHCRFVAKLPPLSALIGDSLSRKAKAFSLFFNTGRPDLSDRAMHG